MVFSVVIFVDYVPSLTVWLASAVYIYGSKNSAAQLMAVASILLLCTYNTNAKKHRVLIKYCSLGFLLAVVLLIRARAAFVGILVSMIFYPIMIRRFRLRYILLLMAFLIFALSDQRVLQLLKNAFLLNRYAGQGLDAFSSGRLTFYGRALDRFLEFPLIGVGKYYVDNLYINVLTELGIVGGVPILLLWFCRAIMNARMTQVGRESDIFMALRCMTIFYLSESLFEAYPPFGPGATTFIFWLLCGYVDGRKGLGL